MRKFVIYFLVFISNIKGNLSECLDNCASILNSECIDDECKCPSGYVLNTKSDECLLSATEYHGSCSEDVQCSWLGDNSKCLYGYICGCDDQFVWFKGKCQKYAGLGEDCKDSNLCFDGYNFESLVCKDDKCVCNDGYYQRGNTDCRKKATKINDVAKCALDLDCQFENEKICHIGKCINPATNKNFLIQQEEEEEAHEIIEEVATISSREVIECEVDNDCSSIANSYCENKQCICKQGYFFNSDSQCIAEIGVATECKEDDDCPLKPGKCVDGTCYCRDYYFVEDGNRKCVKTMSQNNWNCLSKEWCYALGKYSYCNSNETCTCSHTSRLDEENTLCTKPTDTSDDFCDNDFMCQSQLQNKFCIDEKCQCAHGFRLENDACLPNIGSQCDNTTLICSIENAICDSQNICSCVDNFIVSGENTKCYPIKDLNEDCEVSEQCSEHVLNADCLDNKCSCIENYEEYLGTCIEKRDVYSYCTNRLQCNMSLGESFVCRNSKCQCPTGFTLRDNHCSSAIQINHTILPLILIFVIMIVC